MRPLRMVLASGSPRRSELLRLAGFKVVVMPTHLNERRQPGESAKKLVTRLAFEKANWVALKLGKSPQRTIILGADTLVLPASKSGDLIFGKPRNEKHAYQMLRRLAGKFHTVLTGVCVLEVLHAKIIKRADLRVKSIVQMRNFSSDQILRYVRTQEPMDKAGAYAAQGKGMALIQSIRGSYTNVVGIPLCQLILLLEDQFQLKIL